MVNDNNTPLSGKDNKFYGNAFQDNDRKSSDSIHPDSKFNLESKQIPLELSKELEKDDVVTRIFVLKGERNCIIVELNESYNKKKFIISVTNNWNRFINQTRKQMNEKKIEKDHIEHILDTLDNNYELIADFGDKQLDQPNESISENIVVNPYNSPDYSNLTYEEWTTTILTKLQSLKEIVNGLIPEIWDPLEFALSVMRILNIKDCSLPFAGIILGSPSSFKTVVIELLRGYPNTFYTDSFSPKSFVSHNTAVSQDMLKKIDLLPKIKGRIFLTPELSPIFSKRIEELIELLGIITRILDGHGYESDSGAQGHRGYNQK